MDLLYDKLQVLESEDRELVRSDRLKAINRPLLAWYQTHARVLPWREEPKPYRVWVSEIMLQQTRVEAVKPYFERFMKELPGIQDLAAVPEDRLLKLWEGLGYYNRVKNLQKAAILIMEQYDGEMPCDYEKLLSLPGIGSYTAGAISSIAYGIAVPAVDGNVLRVVSRVLASKEDISKQSVKKQMEAELKDTMPAAHASHFNQGLIEIGALVCIPNGQPKCGECPLESLCLAKKQGVISEIPVKTPKKERRIEEKTVCIIEAREMIALRKRENAGLLASLYELPNEKGYLKEEQISEKFGLLESEIDRMELLPSAKHIFTHIEWHMIAYRVFMKNQIPAHYLAVTKQALKEEYPLPNAFNRYMKLIK